MDYICRKRDFFKNPNKLPLNELQLEIKTIRKKKKIPIDKITDIQDVRDTLHKNYDVRVEKKLALDLYWIQKEHSYCKYQPYYFEMSQDENELFIPKNKLFLENLTFLLQCTYHQFWNYVLFEPRVKIILRSFIFSPIQIYEISELEEEYMHLYNEIYNKVANIYLRMLTSKESSIEYMSEETMIKLLETNKLFTYIEIVNLFMLYNKSNPKLIDILYRTFFSDIQKAKYTKELKRIFNHTLLVFEMVGGQVCGFEENSIVIPVGIRTKLVRFDPYWVEEVATYLLDTGATLNALLTNCPPAVEVATQLGLPYRMSYFYSKVYPALYEMMHNRANLPCNWSNIQNRILNRIAMGRCEFINAFHAFVTKLIDNIIQTLGDNEKQDAFLEQYLSLISAVSEDEFFIFDYHNTNPIDVQIQTLSDFHPEMDHMRTNYILECLSTLPSLEHLRKMKREEKQPYEFTLPSQPSTSQKNNTSANECNNENIAHSEADILELTKTVMDTLPHLGDGFVRECLLSYNYNTSEVISAILDDNLPPHLDRLPRDLVYLPPEPEPEQPILAYKGKKPDYKDASQLLNDKTELNAVKDFVLKVSNVSFDMYDDEYDDRDDDEPVLRFYDKTDESSMYKHMENRFEGYELVSDPSESSSEEEAPPTRSKPKDAFCEDPALLRERREASRQHNNKNRDVVGKPKGQGQDKEVLKNREKKNVHKSSRANHNRKGGAQWKRSKGMMPF